MRHNALWQGLEFTKEKGFQSLDIHSHSHTQTHTELGCEKGTQTFTIHTEGHTMPGRPFSHFLHSVIQLLFFVLSPLSPSACSEINCFPDYTSLCSAFFTMRVSFIFLQAGNIGQIGEIGSTPAGHTQYGTTHTHTPTHHNSSDSHSARMG